MAGYSENWKNGNNGASRSQSVFVSFARPNARHQTFAQYHQYLLKFTLAALQ
jgi:hypothetical protein